MDPLRIHITNPTIGEVTWTFPPSLQAQLESYPNELQQHLKELITVQLEAFVRTLGANITAGSTADVLISLLNDALTVAAEQSIRILQLVESGALPPCGNANCASPHN